MISKTALHILRNGWPLVVLSLGTVTLRGAEPGAPLRAEAQPAPAPPSGARSSTIAFTNSMDVLDNKRPLGVGDRVSLRVVEDRKPPIETYVTDSGDMEVPLIGRVKAQGKTCKTLAREIKAALDKEYFYNC